MSQEGRVLQTLEGSRFWLTGEVRPLGNVNHAGGCCSCALLCLARGRSWEDGPAEGSQAGDLQTEQVMSEESQKTDSGLHVITGGLNRLLMQNLNSQLCYVVYGLFFFYIYTMLSSVSCVTCAAPSPSENRLIQTADWRAAREGDLNPHIYLCTTGECCVLLPHNCCRAS